ncbi:MAG: hypothetical protein AB2556_24435, partial [Candidatus Thiodiazotropha sp.]
HRSVELICQNGHAWPKDLHFPQSREVHIYEGDVWQAIREATRGQSIAVWLLGGQDRQLSVDQLVLRPPRLQDTRVQATCSKLGKNHADSIMAKEKSGWKPTPASHLLDIQKACVEHGHGGLWNSMGYDTEDIISIDLKACYPESFQGMGEAKPYLERFGHPTTA